MTGEEKDAAIIFHVIEAALQFFDRLRDKELVMMKGFAEGKSGETPICFQHGYLSSC